MTTITSPEKNTPPLDADSASQNIALSLIVPSKTNPGRAFDPARDSDMVESIRVHGVLQPILVRAAGGKGCSFQTKGKFEIVGGERRYTCSQKAGRTTIPAVIRHLTDVEALELQTIENDQREDLDPMSKAAAFRRLWEAYNKSGDGKNAEQRMESMAERLGRKPRTVWQLLSLSKLTPQGEKMLREGSISQSHAYEICQRPPAEQKKILEWMADEARYGSPASVRELKSYIREECDHFLDAAPFDKKDATLFPAAGACITCFKNTAVNPNLVDAEDLKGKHGGKRAICTDGECFKTKVANNLVRIEEAAKQKHGEDMVLRLSIQHDAPKGSKPVNEWKEVKRGECKNAFAGVIVDGEQPGKEVFACAATFCKTHWGRGSGSTRREVSRPRTDAEKKAMLQKQRNKKLDEAYRVAATAAIRKQVTALKLPDMQEVATVLFDRLDRRLQNPVMVAMGWKPSASYYGVKTPTAAIAKLKPAELAAFISLVSIADKVLPGVDYFGHSSPITLEGFAKRHKINLAKIHATAAAPLQQKWKEIDAKKRKALKAGALQTSAKKKRKAVAVA